ncbi:GspE/PulE/PilB domain-containing protein [Clostridium estertheticum]|uniref:GspE/PulE/PilB domain-containing protein n=1 Tax=Clostridium estertheticum TaxID=238834 RepID=UPI001CF40526|nr:hypothetical protein [Clostridium estertheticum]MCB2341724.1 hypothetical protein [Clostridium estertheticum]
MGDLLIEFGKITSEELNKVLAFGTEDNKIKVAMSDPLNMLAIDDVKISSGFNVEIFIKSPIPIKNNSCIKTV